MVTYSLLQVSLDQTIDRQTLEQAASTVPSVAHADCVQIQRDLHGILVSHLPLHEAQTFQAALKLHGFLTHLVADQDLPTLHEPFTVQRIRIQGDILTFTDALGRTQSRPRHELVFVAGGFLSLSKIHFSLNSTDPATPHRPEHITSGTEFRLDFFFWSAPHRLRASLSQESTLFYQDRPMRLRDTALIFGAMLDLQELLPPSRITAGLQRLDTTTFYPSLKSYEEEIRWHFHHLQSAAKTSPDR
mgnify:CR=1 FL=1